MAETKDWIKQFAKKKPGRTKWKGKRPDTGLRPLPVYDNGVCWIRTAECPCIVRGSVAVEEFRYIRRALKNSDALYDFVGVGGHSGYKVQVLIFVREDMVVAI